MKSAALSIFGDKQGEGKRVTFQRKYSSFWILDQL